MIELFENTSMNKYAIKLVQGKQLSYRPIYNLKLVELVILKTYIKTNLKTGFFQPSKFASGTPIFFDRKPNRSFRLYVNYQDLNSMTIKNWYLLFLINKALDKLDWVKCFI